MEARELPPSVREKEVLRLLAWGHTLKEIAAKLDVSGKTVETYKQRGLKKLNLKSRADLVRYAVQAGWLVDESEDLISGLLATDHETRLNFFLDGLRSSPGWLPEDVARLESTIRIAMTREPADTLPFRLSPRVRGQS